MSTRAEDGQWDPDAALTQLEAKYPPEKPSAAAQNPENTAIAAGACGSDQLA